MTPKERALLGLLDGIHRIKGPGPIEVPPSETKHGRRADLKRMAEAGLITYTVETKKFGPVALAYYVTVTDAGRAALKENP